MIVEFEMKVMIGQVRNRSRS